MIYFKTIPLTDLDKHQVEKAIRKVASKKDTSLDFTSSGAMAGTDRLFIGSEDKNDVKFARIRYYLEDLLPKIILSFPRSDNDQFYKMRLSARSFAVFCLIALLLFFSLILSFN